MICVEKLLQSCSFFCLSFFVALKFMQRSWQSNELKTQILAVVCSDQYISQDIFKMNMNLLLLWTLLCLPPPPPPTPPPLTNSYRADTSVTLHQAININVSGDLLKTHFAAN